MLHVHPTFLIVMESFGQSLGELILILYLDPVARENLVGVSAVSAMIVVAGLYLTGQLSRKSKA